MNDDPEYRRIEQLCRDVIIFLLDEKGAEPGDLLHIAAHLTHTAMLIVPEEQREEALRGYFDAVRAVIKTGVDAPRQGSHTELRHTG